MIVHTAQLSDPQAWCKSRSAPMRVISVLCRALVALVCFAIGLASDASSQAETAGPSPDTTQPAQTALTDADGATWRGSIEDPPQTWAVDAYPEPEFDYDLIRKPSNTSTGKQQLRVVSWHLDDAVTAGLVTRKVQPKKTWRHTFGSERLSESVVSFDTSKLGADVVLLQGVRSIREVRKLFPARDWKIVVSRQLLKSLDNVHTGRQVKPANTGATAIAVRYQRDVRVTAVRHLPQLASQLESRSNPARRIDASAASGAKDVNPTHDISSAGTAIRIYSGGKVRWLAAVAFSQSCRKTPDQCPELDALKSWMMKTADNQSENSIPLLLGGQIPDKASSAQGWTWLTQGVGACAHQRFDISPPPENIATEMLHETGCLVAVDIK